MAIAFGPQASRLESEMLGSERSFGTAGAEFLTPLCEPCKATEVEAATSAGDSDTCSTTGSDGDLSQGDAAGLASLGSMNHPHACAEPCKYHFKSSGCKDGAQCTRCHLCPWKRSTLKAKAAAREAAARSSEPLPSQPTLVKEVGSLAALNLVYQKLPEPAKCPEPSLTSLGSVGHCRGECGPPCKHFRRKDGCRKGWECLRCHECRWMQHGSGKSEQLGRLLDYAPGQALLAAIYGSAQ